MLIGTAKDSKRLQNDRNFFTQLITVCTELLFDDIGRKLLNTFYIVVKKDLKAIIKRLTASGEVQFYTSSKFPKLLSSSNSERPIF